MIEQPVIHSLIDSRGDIFKHTKYMAGLGIRIDKLEEAAIDAMIEAVNTPSFVLDHAKIMEDAKGDRKLAKHYKRHQAHTNGRFCLPYNSFSYVLVKHGSPAVWVFSRKDDVSNGTTDSMKVAVFQKVDREWVMAAAMVLAIREEDGKFIVGSGLVGVLPADLDIVDANLRKMGKGYSYNERRNHFTETALNQIVILNSIKETSIRVPTGKPMSLMQASKTKPKDWVYKVIKMKSIKGTAEWKGGHHASPVKHDRQGFDREYTHPRYVNMRGKTQRIEPTVVCKHKEAQVVKDYVV